MAWFSSPAGDAPSLPRWRRYSLACSLVLGAFFIRYFADPRLEQNEMPYLLFLPAVLLSVWLAGFGAGLFSLLLGFLLGEFFLLHPPGFRPFSPSSGMIDGLTYLAAGLLGLTMARRWRLNQALWQRAALTAQEQGEMLRRQMAERSELEQVLAQQRAILEQIYETVPAGVLVVSQEGQRFFSNQQFREIWGFPAEFAAGKDEDKALNFAAAQTVSPDQFIRGVHAAYARPQEKVQDEVVFRDGRVYSRYGSAVRHPDGRDYGWLWFFLDITERRRSAMLLGGHNRVLKSIAERSPLKEVLRVLMEVAEERFSGMQASLLLLDEQSNTLKLGSAPSLPREFQETLHSLPVGPAAGSSGAAAALKQPVYVRDIATDPLWEHYRHLALPLGLRACWATPIIGLGGRVLGTFAAYFREVRHPTSAEQEAIFSLTELARIAIENRQAETQLKKATEQLNLYASQLEERVAQRTAKLQETVRSLEGFCYSIAHDLRAPLRAIQGFLQIMEQEYFKGFDEAGHGYVQRIVSSAARMDVLIQDLLIYGRLSHEDLSMGRVQLETVVSQVLENLRGHFTERGAEVQVQKPLATVWGNASVLEQVVTNLLENALKFVGPGVVPHVELGTRSDSRAVQLWVRDNGIGIDPIYHKRIFQVFERLHSTNTFSGTGIGLAIVAKAVERLDGRVWVESAPGKGSTFWVELHKSRPA